MSFDPTTKFSDFVGAVDDHLAATLADDVHGLAGAVIVETGSNERGNWVKYGNGIMECWHEVNLTHASANSLNTIWVFPQPFSVQPDVQLTLISHLLRGSIAAGGALTFHSLFIRQISNTQVQPQAQSSTSSGYSWAETDNIYVKCRALGRWK